MTKALAFYGTKLITTVKFYCIGPQAHKGSTLLLKVHLLTLYIDFKKGKKLLKIFLAQNQSDKYFYVSNLRFATVSKLNLYHLLPNLLLHTFIYACSIVNFIGLATTRSKLQKN